MGADVICHGSGFVVEPAEMEKALIKPRLAVIRRLIEHGAAATPDLTQAVVDERNESFGELAQFLKMAEDPESAPLILKIHRLVEGGQHHAALQIIRSLGAKAFEAYLAGCSMDDDCCLAATGLLAGHPWLAMQLVAHCPPEAQVDEKIKRSNIKQIQVGEWLEDLEVIKNFENLDLLKIETSDPIIGLEKLKNVRSLQVLGCGPRQLLDENEDLSALVNLQHVDLSISSDLEDITGLGKIPSLKSLNLRRCNALNSFDELAKMTTLEELDLSYLKHVPSASLLAGLKNLRKVDLSGVKESAELDQLKRLQIEELVF